MGRLAPRRRKDCSECGLPMHRPDGVWYGVKPLGFKDWVCVPCKELARPDPVWDEDYVPAEFRPEWNR